MVVLSEAQRRVLAINPKITGVLSLLCSALVVYSVVRDPRKRSKIYHRLLLGISIMDMNNGIWFGMSTWPIVADSGLPYAVGNQTTCELQGFFIQCGIAASLYNGSLSLYYLLVLRYNWTERHVRQYEHLLHMIPVVWGFGTAVMAIPLRLYNNATLWCWIAPYPSTCTDHSNCIRGAFAANYRWSFYYGPLWCMILLVTYAQISTYLHIRKVLAQKMREEQVGRENKKQRLREESSRGRPTRSAMMNGRVNSSNRLREESSKDDDDDDENNVDDVGLVEPESFHNKTEWMDEEELHKKEVEDAKLSKMSRRRLREIAIQNFLYAGSFYINWIFLTCVRIMQASHASVGFPLLALAATITPFQGMANLFIYIFPAFLHNKRAKPKDGPLRWFLDAI